MPKSVNPVVTVRSVVSAIPDFGIAATFLLTWLNPERFGQRAVAHLVGIMLLEFIVIHSSAFMGQVALSKESRRMKARAILAFGTFYSLFAGGFALSLKSWWPFAAFWLLTANRLLRVTMGGLPTKQEKRLMHSGWVLTTLFYMGFTALTIFVPVPEFGITRDVARAQEFSGDGLWEKEPHRVVASGFLYFTSLGVAGIFADRLARGSLGDLEMTSQ